MKLIKVKHFRQRPDYCGPATLKILFSHYGVDKTEDQLAKLSSFHKTIGTHHEGMIKAAKNLGFKVFDKERSSLKELDRLVNKRGIPVVVGWFSEWTDHYSVVIGLDEKFVYLDNPEEDKAPQKITRELFKHLWFDFVGKNDEHVCWGWMMWVEGKVGSRSGKS